jgi:hypothetical protein
LSACSTVATTMRILAITAEEALIVGSAALPSEFARTASEWTVACVALIISNVVAAGATQ